MTISRIRLRNLVATSNASHAALMSAASRWRYAKTDLTAAQAALVLYDRTAHQHEVQPGKDGLHHRARLVRAVDAAAEAAEAASVAHDRAAEVWQHEGGLTSRAIEYAREQGVILPELEN